MSNVTICPLSEGETDRFFSYDELPVPGVSMETRRSYSDLLSSGNYRPEWTWIAERDGRVVGRAAWWGAPGERPWSLDWFDPGTEPDRVDIGARLAAAGLAKARSAEGEDPQMHLFLPVDWRSDPEAKAAADVRIEAATAGGFTPFLERYSYRWAPSDGLPQSSGRLTFREVPDEDELRSVLRRLLVGTLDGSSARDVERYGLDQAAEIQRKELDWFPSPREWWRLGITPEGEIAGFIMPARNLSLPVVGYIGVVPEQRGRGYVHDLLTEMTRFLASEMEPGEEIAADTDFGNVPMDAAFKRAGYRTTAVRIVLT